MDHREHPSDIPEPILDHRDSILDPRERLRTPRERLRAPHERRNDTLESIPDSREPSSDKELDRLDIREDPRDSLDAIRNDSRCIFDVREDPNWFERIPERSG